VAYYDVDRACVRKRMFSKLEVARTNEIFGQIEHVLLENNYDIRGKYITVGKCR